MKSDELIRKILNKELKSGTMIKMINNNPNLYYEKVLCFNGNWFSEGEYEIGCKRYDDIVLHLCSEDTIFEIIEEKKIPEKIDELIEIKSSDKIESIVYEIASTQRKINEIIDYLKSEGDE